MVTRVFTYGFICDVGPQGRGQQTAAYKAGPRRHGVAELASERAEDDAQGPSWGGGGWGADADI